MMYVLKKEKSITLSPQDCSSIDLIHELDYEGMLATPQSEIIDDSNEGGIKPAKKPRSWSARLYKKKPSKTDSVDLSTTPREEGKRDSEQYSARHFSVAEDEIDFPAKEKLHNICNERIDNERIPASPKPEKIDDFNEQAIKPTKKPYSSRFHSENLAKLDNSLLIMPHGGVKMSDEKYSTRFFSEGAQRREAFEKIGQKYKDLRLLGR